MTSMAPKYANICKYLICKYLNSPELWRGYLKWPCLKGSTFRETLIFKMFGIQLEFLWCTYIPHMDLVTLRRCPRPSGRNLTASPNVQVQLRKIDSSQMTVIMLPFVVTTPKFWYVSYIMLILIFGCCHLHCSLHFGCRCSFFFVFFSTLLFQKGPVIDHGCQSPRFVSPGFDAGMTWRRPTTTKSWHWWQ